MELLKKKSNEFFEQRKQKKHLEEQIKAYDSQLIHTGTNSLEKMLEDQKKLIRQYQNKIKNLESQKGRSSDELPSEQLFERQNMLLMNLAAKLNERDEVNMHLN